MLELNVWKNKAEIEKTHKAEEGDIFWGTLEDIIEKIDLDTFFDINDGNIIFEIGKRVTKVIGCIKPVLLDVFPELTEAELRKCKSKEIKDVFVKIIKFAYGNFDKISNTGDEGN